MTFATDTIIPLRRRSTNRMAWLLEAEKWRSESAELDGLQLKSGAGSAFLPRTCLLFAA
eukprot:COSAG04_NODE_231_length_19199_cov_263.690209_8_plen_59_part_00